MCGRLSYGDCRTAAPTGTYAPSAPAFKSRRFEQPADPRQQPGVPEWNMVVVRLGADEQDTRISDESYGEFLRPIGESLKRER